MTDFGIQNAELSALEILLQWIGMSSHHPPPPKITSLTEKELLRCRW